MSALQAQNYDTAIKEFTEARKLAPEAALGEQAFAEDSIGDRDLRAIALYNAYLEAAPDAPRAPKVKKRIEALEAEEMATIESLIDQFNLMVSNMPDEDTKEYYVRKNLKGGLAEVGHISCFRFQTSYKSDDTSTRIKRWVAGLDEEFEYENDDLTMDVPIRGQPVIRGGPFEELHLGGNINTDFRNYLTREHFPPGWGIQVNEPEWQWAADFYMVTIQVLSSELNCIEDLQNLYQ